MVSSAYLRLLRFLPAVLIPACASYSPAFLMMYSAYDACKINGASSVVWTLNPLYSKTKDFAFCFPEAMNRVTYLLEGGGSGG